MKAAAVPACLLLACGSPPKKPAPEPKPLPTRVAVEEPEDEEGVTYTSDRGTMDIEVIKAGLAPHQTALSECYTTRVGARRWLGGQVTLHWEITKDAEVTSVQIAESDLGSWDVEKCVLEVARAATFAAPRGGADAEFEVPLMFEKGRPAVAWDEEQSLRAVGGQVALLDECEVDNAELAKLRKARAKYKKPARKPKTAKLDPDEPRLIAKPDDVAVTVYIGPGGKALSVGFASPRTVLDDQWTDCAAKTALGWRLPDPKGGIAKVTARYRPAQ